MDPNSLESKVGRHDSSKSSKDLARSKDKKSPQAQLQPQQKKQVRRRIHAAKSYQGRVMNMAEARREIVTALRIHRSLMKANETHTNQLHSTSQQDYPSSSLLTEKSHGEMNSGRTTRIYPSTDTNSITHSSSFRNNFSIFNSSPPDFHRSSYPTMEVGTIYDKLNMNLSSRYPLVLNPNYSDSDTGFPFNSSNSSISSSYSLPPNSSTLSSSSSSSYSHTSSTMVPLHESKNEEYTATLHPVMDEEKMAEIQSIGERHALEWNDKLNTTTMLWWYELLNASETSPFSSEGNNEGQAELEEAEEIPYWTCDEQHLDLCTPEIHYSQHDPMFP